MLFVDAEHDNEVLTFREVFLGSRALELLVAGYVPGGLHVDAVRQARTAVSHVMLVLITHQGGLVANSSEAPRTVP